MAKLKATRDELALAILESIPKQLVRRKEIVDKLKEKWAERTIDYHLHVMERERLLSVSTKGKLRGLYSTTTKGRQVRAQLVKLREQQAAIKEAEEVEDAKRVFTRRPKIDWVKGKAGTIEQLTVTIPAGYSMFSNLDIQKVLYYRLVKRKELDTLEYGMAQMLHDWSYHWPELPATLQE